MVFSPDLMYPVGFDIIGLKISLSEALRLVRLNWLGEMMAKAFCLCSAVLPAWFFLLYRITSDSCVPTGSSFRREHATWKMGEKGKHYMKDPLQGNHLRKEGFGFRNTIGHRWLASL